MLETIKKNLSAKMNCVDYIHFCTKFLVSNDKNISKVKTHKVRSYTIYYLNIHKADLKICQYRHRLMKIICGRSAKEVAELDPNLIMASFDVKSLFTKIPLTETICFCVENLYKNQTHIDSLSKSSFRRFLEMTM